MRKALGKGLEALFPGTSAPETSDRATVAITDVVPNPDQPRRAFDEEALGLLADSIRRVGILQPLVVRRAGLRYELIAGERRLRAATRAGLTEVPIVIREAADTERLELALIENLQRRDLSPLEEAEAYKHLADDYALSQEDIATRVGKSRPAIANALRLLALPEEVKARLESGELSAGHARAVLSLDDAGAQVDFAEEIVVGRLTKREAEGRVAARRSRPARARASSKGQEEIHERAVADQLTRSFGTRVRLIRRGKGGRIEIEFYSEAELQSLVDRLLIAADTRPSAF